MSFQKYLCSTAVHISTSVLFHFYLKCVIYVAPVISAEELRWRTQGFAVTHLFCSLLVTLPCAEQKAVLKWKCTTWNTYFCYRDM